jgi:N-methylhydantoinase A/oxoprolinase/acetone carboxylase beta subunit
LYTVDIDVGGTMTDGLFCRDGETMALKVDTTPHDLTVCLFDCLNTGALRLGFHDLANFLENVAVIRWNSTVATNVLAERKGPKLGLLVSRGGAATLYGEDQSPALGTLISRDAVIEISHPAEAKELLTRVKALLERGVRRICVSLQGAFAAPEEERQVKRAVEKQYPDHTLGSVPVLLGSDILKHPDDRARTHHVLVNSYVHGPLATSLFKAEDRLLFECGYRRPFLIGHINGGVARVAKTRAVDTVEAGPVFGVHGATFFARRYSDQRVISMDVGGTTVKVGLVVDGTPFMSRAPEVFGIPLTIPMVSLTSIALGGGSLAAVGPVGVISLGPESAGAVPGPACYNLGGGDATLTDAFVTLGWINPEYFQGGDRVLDLSLAKKALEEHVADPIGVFCKDGATMVAELAFEMVASAIRRAASEGNQPLDGSTLYAFGGNGPLFACGVADRLPIRRVRLFDVGPVFSAFGSSVSPVAHTYEEGLFLPLDQLVLRRVKELVARMRKECARDMAGEGFAHETVRESVEIDVSDGADMVVTARFGALELEGSQPEQLLSQLQKRFGLLGQRVDLYVQRVRLRGECVVTTSDIKEKPLADSSPTAALKGERLLFWGREGRLTVVYQQERLVPGNELSGPAVVEAAYSTALVPPGWRFCLDGFSNGLLTREEARS